MDLRTSLRLQFRLECNHGYGGDHFADIEWPLREWERMVAAVAAVAVGMFQTQNL